MTTDLETRSLAPELQTSAWFNTDKPLTLQALRGKVVVLHAFQMLCPGCVSHGLPQARLVTQHFDPADVAVIGLHTVFEHHDVMTENALEAFIHEYRLTFPIAVDRPASSGPLPLTMAAYQLQGTPSVVVIDRQGRIRLHEFGRISDMALGATLGQLVTEPVVPPRDTARDGDGSGGSTNTVCDDEGCPAPRS